MNDPLETPDRRPLVYGVFAVVILLVAAFLFWPGSEPTPSGTDMILTPESTQTQASEEVAAADLVADGSLDAMADATETAADTPSTDPAAVEATRLETDPGPAVETHIDDAPARTTPPPPAREATRTERTLTRPTDAPGTEPSRDGNWVLNVGAFGSRANADSQVEDLARKGIVAHVHATTKSDGTALYRVRVGYFGTSSQAKTYGEWLKKSKNMDSWAGPR